LTVTSKVLLYADPCFLRHETGSHPESADRLRAVYSHLQSTGLMDRFDRGQIRSATLEELLPVHGREYIDHIERWAAAGGGQIEADTVMSPDSFVVACQAAGSAIDAVEHVVGGNYQRALCLIRPPGHHALRDAPMGFCLFNNVAVAARHAIDRLGLSRLLIVDWDVHHGNGTQDAFYSDGHVHFFSSHRSPFYPGTGRAEETGTGAGLGTIFNLPLRFGIARQEFRERFHSMLERAAARARPELILISAGFDAHRADPIGSLGLESEDFSDLTRLVLDCADQYSGGKIVSLLEGGYNLRALAESVQAHVEELTDASRGE
jgi:acetoin utilization deacetylase AcuC-like enzyme